MKLILLLLFPVCCFGQAIPKITLGDVTVSPSNGTWGTATCTRTYIDTLKNVEWFVEIRSDIDSGRMPISTSCSNYKCMFLHTWNDLTKEEHWYDVFHRTKESDWAYYIHEVKLVCLKQVGKPIVYSNH